MLIGLVIAVCIVLLILGFVAPRLSAKPQHGVDRTFGTGGRLAGKAPGPLGRWLRKPFSTSQRAADKSASAGRRGRRKMPL
jgi:Family of unknown function (DUF6411)